MPLHGDRLAGKQEKRWVEVVDIGSPDGGSTTCDEIKDAVLAADGVESAVESDLGEPGDRSGVANDITAPAVIEEVVLKGASDAGVKGTLESDPDADGALGKDLRSSRLLSRIGGSNWTQRARACSRQQMHTLASR